VSAERHKHIDAAAGDWLGMLVGQARVVELFAGPGGIAELLQAHHARAALERVERTADGGHLAEIVGRLVQVVAGGARGLYDFARFLEEDLAHLVVFGEIEQPGVFFTAEILRPEQLFQANDLRPAFGGLANLRYGFFKVQRRGERTGRSTG